MTERLLIHQILSGDAESFGRLIDQHYDRCARVAVRILGNREDAEEAVQDCFVRAFRALEAYEDRERFSAWLMRILINQCRTKLAGVRRREAVDAALEDADFPRHAYQSGGDAGWPDLERALAALPPDQREAIVLRYTDDLTYDEMSRITGVGASALKMRVQRAFTRLRALLVEVPSV